MSRANTMRFSAALYVVQSEKKTIESRATQKYTALHFLQLSNLPFFILLPYNLLLLFLGKVSWPTGKYGLPMPKAGCPNNWFEGRRFHDDKTGNLVDREAYNNLHLAGWITKEGMRRLN